MKQRRLLTIVVTVIGAIVFGISYLAQFFTTGIHIWGRYAHIETQQNCYFIDPETKEITGSSVFTISGTLINQNRKFFGGDYEASTFSGHMEVASYPISMTDGFRNHQGVIDRDKIVLSSQGGIAQDQTLETYYTVEIIRAAPETVVIYIYQDNGDALVAVCGKSEADALGLYQQYLEK